MSPSGMRLELDHVRFGHEPDREVLHDITATFEPGSVTGHPAGDLLMARLAAVTKQS